MYALQADYTAAIAVYLEALQLDTRNAETLTTIGLLYLRIGQNQKAFDFLGNALSHDPKSVKAILAAASVIQAGCLTHLPFLCYCASRWGWLSTACCVCMQDHQDVDAALVKYRVAAVQTPTSPQLWNNIGMGAVYLNC